MMSNKGKDPIVPSDRNRQLVDVCKSVIYIFVIRE